MVIVPLPVNASPGGICSGIDGATGVTVLGLVTESGECHFLRDDGTQYFGTLSVRNTTVSGSFTGVTALGSTFQDGSFTGTGTYPGVVQQRSTLNGMTAFTTSAGLASNSTVNLSFLARYNRAPSLATIAGNYRDPSTGAVINANASGAVFSQEPFTGCIVNGTVSIIDARYNAYRVEYSYSGCMGAASLLNGTTTRGLGTLDNSLGPGDCDHRRGQLDRGLLDRAGAAAHLRPCAAHTDARPELEARSRPQLALRNSTAGKSFGVPKALFT